MTTMNVSLPKQMKDWVEKQTDKGRYSNTSDYVRDLIRKDQKRQESIALLQQAITEGVESGIVEEFDPADFKLEMRKRYSVKD